MGNTTMFHPLTGMLITPVGYRKDGRAIWPVMGAEDAPPADQPPAAPADPPAQQASPPADPPPITPPPADDGKGGKAAVLADLSKERNARQAAEQARDEATNAQKQMLDGIAKALGIKPEDTPPDPAALQRTLGERETRVTTLENDIRSRDVELAAWRVAARQGVNAASLMDSRSFLNEVAQLDPQADDFGSKLETAVKAAVENNPALRGTVVPAGHAGIGVTGSSAISIADAPARDLMRAGYESNNTR